MLLSGAGLIGIVVLNLWQAVRDADSRALLNAKVNADATARDLKAVLGNPDLLELLPTSRRFVVADGVLQIPAEVGWLDSPPDLDPYDDLDLVIQEKLDRATRLEFEADDAVGAAKLFVQVLQDAALFGGEKQWVTSLAAWQAHRAGATERRESLRRILDESEGASLESLASSLLLTAATGHPLPPWSTQVRLLAPDDARAVLARLEERGLETGEMRRALTETVARREVHLTVETEVGALLRDGQPIARELGERLLLFFPATGFPENAGGEGALVPAPELTTVLRTRQLLAEGDTLPAIRWSGEIVHGEPSPDAFVVVAGLLAVEPTVVSRSLLSQPWVLGAVMGLLAVVFGLGLFFSLRSLRREAEAIRTRAQFLITVTHELKTPLAGIRLLSEMLEEGRVQAEGKQREYFSLLSGEAARLTMLIENVLDLGRMERGERSYDMRSETIGAVVREAAELFGPVAERDGMHLALQLQETSRVRLDRGAFIQALLNVMDNARKYAAQGGRLDVRDVSINGTYEVSIRDHGPGIPTQETTQIFQRFERGARHQSGSIPGVGLGLYLARTIAQRHGGDLRVEAAADGGSGACFRFILPLDNTQPKP